MFEPVAMTRLQLVILERHARAVLHYLGQSGAIQLSRAPAGPDTAPLPPRQHGAELVRLGQVSSRLDGLRRAMQASPPVSAAPAEISLAEAEKQLAAMESAAAAPLNRRQQLQQRLAELAAVDEQLADYRAVDVPLDRRDESSFLHFLTGSLPARNYEKLAVTDRVAILPMGRRSGRQWLVAMTTRPNREALENALQHVGFQADELPAVAGWSAAVLWETDRREQERLTADLEQVTATLKSQATAWSATWAQIERAVAVERGLAEAEQNFARTESALLVTGWAPAAETAGLARHLQELTHGQCVLEMKAAKDLPGVEIPVLLRHPRLLQPFALLVTAYGLPRYGELEPTIFVAISYLLMFGMMFGDAGHGLVLALAGLGCFFASRRPVLRQAGQLVAFAGSASILSGIVYGSYFGLESLKKFALWHDPLAGNPAALMTTAIEIGIVMISLGLVLNIINHLRHGEFAAALLDKFGVAGLVFYWGALALVTQSAAFRARGLWVPALVTLLGAPVAAWMLKEPLEHWHRRRPAESGSVPGGGWGLAMESGVNAFEALLSYFANTVSFVRLAAYAMSHAALLMAAFMIAEDLRRVAVAGPVLGLLAVLLGNLLALVLEGIVASVQALRLEYYEFFGKFFSGGGQPFAPFRLQTNPVADAPP